jgi:diacylglycerol kinase (ATP)
MTLERGQSLLIVNRLAGGGWPTRAVPRVTRTLDALGMPYALRVADGYDEVVRVAAAAREFARVVAVGGDGTVNAVVNGLVRSGADVPLGIVPSGTGNEFIRALGIPRDPEEAVRLLASGVPRRIDVGRVNDIVFVNSFGIGLDARVAAAVRSWRRRRWLRGRALYYLAGVRILAASIKPETVEVRVDSRRLEGEAVMVSVVNARPYFARGTANGTLEDGRLDLYLVAPMARWRMVAGLLSRHGWTAQPHVTTFRTPRLDVSLPYPVVAHTDGTLLPPSLAFSLEALPGRIQVIVPPPQ